DEEEPAGGGMTTDSVERIWEAAVDLYRSGVHPAVQVCIHREGAVVLDRTVGHARGNGPRDRDTADKVLATPETPFLIYSGAKAITAFVVHMLHERKLLDIGKPVATYIPEYEAHGKGGITVAHVLAHRAGVPNLPREALNLDRALDRDFLVRALSN